MHTVLLTLHIAAGTVGLAAALAALAARKRRGLHTVTGRVFGATVVVVAATTYGLLPFAPDMWWLGIVATATLAAVAAGVHLARRKPVPHWFRIHLVLMMSAVIAYVTPVAVQFADGNILAWILPTVIGSPLITYRSLVAARVLPAWHLALMPWRKADGRRADGRRRAVRA
ncbi:hypothetical protein O4J56_20105 [Nocardiopsis sp. RSe5-2]|uniref:DUF2306 domain-containing protein n=1 Tax=Nocardiopsis endophytica TaxID=3018445 RepID=A0ABT4U968_9ACTN|nr:hypothetical protein [Nocardiopsis endophytica]MDA2812960.1 hypothetical protein [Nocardiopsis endophytica]